MRNIIEYPCTMRGITNGALFLFLKKGHGIVLRDDSGKLKTGYTARNFGMEYFERVSITVEKNND